MISVIVCTRNRASSIRTCLDSIVCAARKFGLGDIEIVVINNGSTDATQNILEEWAGNQPLKVVVFLEPKPGLSVARNAGLRQASGNIIAFTDDDCIMEEDYFIDLTRHYEGETDPVIRGGRVELGDPADLPITIKTDNDPAYWAAPDHPAGFIHGANFTFRREVFELLGDFDEELGAGTPFPGEDLDYLVRAAAAGVKIHYVPDMVVLHFHGRREEHQAQKLFKQYMRANGALYVKHLKSSPQFSKHFIWLCKSWFADVLHRRHFRIDGLPFGYREIVLGNIDGMVSYVFRKR